MINYSALSFTAIVSTYLKSANIFVACYYLERDSGREIMFMSLIAISLRTELKDFQCFDDEELFEIMAIKKELMPRSSFGD